MTISGLCDGDLQQWSSVSTHVHYRPMLEHPQVLRTMNASICKGVGACEPRNEASVTHEPHAGLHLSAKMSAPSATAQSAWLDTQGTCCGGKSHCMPVIKKWVCRSSEASERSLASKQAELTLAQRALAALQDTSALQSR